MHMRYDAILKYSADQARDDHGRFAAGASGADGDAEHGLLRAAVTAMKAHADALASKVRQTVMSTRFAGASPTLSGGVELRATHEMPAGGSIESHVQLHPHQLVNYPAAAGALAAIHTGLVQAGVQPVPMRSAIGATFAPGRHAR